jgi:hypothetical protein
LAPALSHIGLPASWRFNFPAEHPNGGLECELAQMPLAYRAKIGDLPGRIQDFYDRGLVSLGGATLTERALSPDSLDTRCRLFLEKRFADCLAESRDERALPAYYYGYVREEPFPAALRITGFLPSGNVRAVMADLRGYGHGLEHDLDRTETFLAAGFAVFTLERAEHGLSSRLDPRVDHMRDTETFVRHAYEGLQTVRAIKRNDPRLADAPFVALASSFGASELVGAMRAASSPLGIEAVVFDNPLWSLGRRHPWWQQQALRLLFGAFSAYPEEASERSFMYRRRSAPKSYPYMKEARFEGVTAYFNAFGPVCHPIALSSLDRLLETNAAWLRSGKARAILPPALVLVTPGDEEVNPAKSVSLFRTLRRPGRDLFRPTLAHSPFVGSGDMDPWLAADVARFLLER